MQHNHTTFFSIAITVLTLSTSLYADSEYVDPLWNDNSMSRVSAVDNKDYKNTCGQCHDSYSPGLLPPQSWEKIILNLDLHFDNKVVVEQSLKREILNYLLNGAAGRARYALSTQMIKGLTSEKLIRITELPFFVEKHKGLSGKLHNCSACHTESNKGSFDKKELKVIDQGTDD